MTAVSKEAEKIFRLLCERFTRYSEEKRATTLPTRLSELAKIYPTYSYDPQDDIVREPLLEHVGSLPVIATTLYPYLDRQDVDLGEALIMMAIHDIGELVTGDKITFAKSDDEDEEEQAAALTILEPYYHELYDRVEHQTDPTAQFAKSIDKITPDIIDFLTPPEVTSLRYKSFMGTGEARDIIQMKIDHKLPYMLWDKRLEELYHHILNESRAKLAEKSK